MHRRLVLVLVACVTMAAAACSGEDDATSPTAPGPDQTTTEAPNTTTSTTDAPTTTLAALDHDGVVAALTAIGLCDDPTPGDAAGEALGSLEPTDYTTCSHEGAEVAIWTYPNGDDAREAVAVAEDFACGFDGWDGFALLLAGSTVAQIDGPETGEDGFGIVPSDGAALEEAAVAVGGTVEHAEC